MLPILAALMMQAAAPALPPSSEPETLIGARAIRMIQKPNAMDMALAAPDATTRRGMSGGIVLFCTAAADGHFAACRIDAEEPPGLGFGAAALKLAPKFRMAPLAADGSSVAGGTIRIPIRFRAP